MRRLNLSTILVAFSLSMVAVATLCVGTAGVSLLRRLADDRAQARTRLAADNGVDALAHTAGTLVVAAQQLAERPALIHLAATGQTDSLRFFLEAFRNRSTLTDCAVEVQGRWTTARNPRIAWSQLAPGPVDDWRLVRLAPGEPLILTATARIPRQPRGSVTVATALDGAYALSTGNKVGLPVAILPAEEVEREGLDPRGLLHRRALAADAALVVRTGSPEQYLAARAVLDGAGRPVAVLETSLPASEAEASLGGLTRTLLILTLCVGLVVTALSLWLARHIARPIEALTQAAVRMGHGDFSSPVPVAPGWETGTLANAMEEMREEILRLTSELRRKQAEAEAVLTGIAEGAYSVDRERRIRYVSPQAAQLLGIQPTQAAGRFCGDVLRPREKGGARPCENRCPILHARFRGNASATEHLEMATGIVRSVVITSAAPGAALDGPGGQDVLQFQVIRDESDVEATRRVRDTVLANISHEFRTPLSAQLASLEMLLDKLPEIASPEVRELVLSVERGTLRLAQLIDNLLESTRIEAGKDDLRRQEIALDQVIEEAIEFVAPLIEQRQQKLEVDLPYPLPPITGDGPRLVQVFVNLLANANKFAPPDSTIRIAGSVGEADVRLWVEDQGPGLPVGADDAIFGRFTRSTGAEPEAGGMGLGLYIVKSIVGRHGGDVEARSDETGTRMCVILPRERS